LQNRIIEFLLHDFYRSHDLIFKDIRNLIHRFCLRYCFDQSKSRFWYWILSILDRDLSCSNHDDTLFYKLTNVKMFQCLIRIVANFDRSKCKSAYYDYSVSTTINREIDQNWSMIFQSSSIWDLYIFRFRRISSRLCWIASSTNYMTCSSLISLSFLVSTLVNFDSSQNRQLHYIINDVPRG
jgi:hypothetical protein